MTDCLEVMPSSENCIHKYDEKKEGHKQEQVSDVIYYDFEAVLPRVDGQTGVYSTHEACSYVIFAVNKDEPGKWTPRVYCGTSREDTMEHFFTDLLKLKNMIQADQVNQMGRLK